jgi:hypothetical protein
VPASHAGTDRGAELESALEAAVERLRARTEQAAGQSDSAAEQLLPSARGGEERSERTHASDVAPRSGGTEAKPAVQTPSHKHSLSLIGRIRRARKQRRERR